MYSRTQFRKQFSKRPTAWIVYCLGAFNTKKCKARILHPVGVIVTVTIYVFTPFLAMFTDERLQDMWFKDIPDMLCLW